jgi:hypothetical protein
VKGKRKGYGRYKGTGYFKTGTVITADRVTFELIAGSLRVSNFRMSGAHPSVLVRFDVEYIAHGAWHADVVKKLNRAARKAKVSLQDFEIEGRHYDIPEECPKTGCLACAKLLEMRAAGLPLPSEVFV